MVYLGFKLEDNKTAPIEDTALFIDDDFSFEMFQTYPRQWVGLQAQDILPMLKDGLSKVEIDYKDLSFARITHFKILCERWPHAYILE